MTTRSLKTIKDFAALGPFSESQLRWLIFNANRNGLTQAGAVVRLGRRVYLDVAGFDRWIDSKNPLPAEVQR